MSHPYPHILIVDDDAEDRYMVNLSFHDINWQEHIKLLDSGAGLIKYLDSLLDTSVYPFLIVLDYNMPRMNGMEVLVQLKKHNQYRKIPVVIYSSEMNESLCEKFRAMGAVSCYQKSMLHSQGILLAKQLKETAMQPATGAAGPCARG